MLETDNIGFEMKGVNASHECKNGFFEKKHVKYFIYADQMLKKIKDIRILDHL